jgi:hypothetical protein
MSDVEIQDKFGESVGGETGAFDVDVEEQVQFAVIQKQSLHQTL